MTSSPIDVRPATGNAATVTDIYAAFGRGDVPAILDRLADDVAWESWADNHAQRAGVPWLRPQTGRDGAAAFFAAIAGWEIRDFQVHRLLAADDAVVAEVSIDAVTDAGSPVRDEELHLWSFGANGRVTRFRHYVDTAKHIAAARAVALQ
jgi:ketosteroid isomerase-like protein